MKAILLIGLILAGCTQKLPQTQSGGGPTDFTPKEIVLGNVQLKDAESTVSFYETVTGVPRTNPVIAQEVLVTRDFLPLAGKVPDLVATTQRAYVSLASAFCSQAVNVQVLTPAQGILFVGIDFTKNQAAFNQTFRGVIIDRIALSAWGRLPTQAEKNELLLAMKDFESLPDTSAALKELVILLCTGMLSAADAIRM